MKVSTDPLLALSFALIVLGISSIHFSSKLLYYIIKSQLVVSTDSSTYGMWKHFPHRLPFDIYLYNWTNPQEILNRSVKPSFEEVGPYSFSVDVGKTDITWNDNNNTVSYTLWRHFFPEEETQKRMLEDRVTSINAMALGAAYKCRNWNYLVRKSLSLTLQTLSTRFYLTHTVDELLFTGYEDTLIRIANTFAFYADTNFPKIDRFGWFYQRNGTNYLVDGLYNVGTGKETNFGEVYKWNYNQKVPYYEGMCGDLHASTGENFGLNNYNQYIKFFSAELCRSVILQYVGDTVVDDIPGRKYIVGDFMLDNGTKYPEHKCSCGGECLPAGLFNISSCRFGVPAFASLPHFHRADPYFNSLINVSKPKSDDLDFYVVLEPNTGFPLDAALRLQVNLLLSPMGIHNYEDVPTLFIPVMYLDQKTKIPEAEGRMLKWLLYVPRICIIIGSVLIVSGVVLALYCLIKCSRMRPIKKIRECDVLLRQKT